MTSQLRKDAFQCLLMSSVRGHRTSQGKHLESRLFNLFPDAPQISLHKFNKTPMPSWRPNPITAVQLRSYLTWLLLPLHSWIVWLSSNFLFPWWLDSLLAFLWFSGFSPGSSHLTPTIPQASPIPGLLIGFILTLARALIMSSISVSSNATSTDLPLRSTKGSYQVPDAATYEIVGSRSLQLQT